MKKIVLIAAMFLVFASMAEAGQRTRGYWKKNGTYVSPHYRTSPDSSKMNNWSTKGNINPYTGKRGMVDPYRKLWRSKYGVN